MMSREGKEDIMGLKDALRGVLNGRTCQNWAVLLLCVKQVSFTKNRNYYPHKYNDAYSYLFVDSYMYFSGLG